MDTTIEEILARGLSPQDCAKALNELGKRFSEQNDIDSAIACWEKSMECYGKPGFAQAQLMKVYNQKQRESARSGDSQGIEAYAQKIDALMQKSKDAIRYGY
jgi:hypothetical protein